MKLSEAILLGDSLKKPEPWLFYCFSDNCGCAIGGALIATGMTQQERLQSASIDGPLLARWSWVTPDIYAAIGNRYHEVVSGQMTIEQLADYVRSIEPPEPEAPTVAEAERNHYATQHRLEQEMAERFPEE